MTGCLANGYLRSHGRGESRLAYTLVGLTVIGTPIFGLLGGTAGAFCLSRSKNIFGWGLN